MSRYFMISDDEFNMLSEDSIFSPCSKTVLSLLACMVGTYFGPYGASTPRIWEIYHNKYFVWDMRFSTTLIAFYQITLRSTVPSQSLNGSEVTCFRDSSTKPA